jgi:hypothetical protein
MKFVACRPFFGGRQPFVNFLPLQQKNLRAPGREVAASSIGVDPCVGERRMRDKPLWVLALAALGPLCRAVCGGRGDVPVHAVRSISFFRGSTVAEFLHCWPRPEWPGSF